MGLDFANGFGVGGFFETIGGDVLVVDDEEGIGDFDMRAFSEGIGENTLTQAGLVHCSKIGSICVGTWYGGGVGDIRLFGQF